MRGWPVRAQILAVLAASACTCGEGEVVGRVVPRISVTPLSVAFGEVPIGASKLVSIEVSNPGGAALTVGALSTMVPFSATAVGTTIPAGASARVDVSFSPTDEGEVQGSLQIASDAEDTPTVTVTLSGTGVPGFIDISPRVVDFSRTTAGTARSIELVIDNRGLEPVSGPIAPAGFARPDAYALAGTNLLRPGQFAASARATTTLLLEYTPFVVGDDSGRILFETCGEGCGLLVQVVADAVSAAVRVEPGAIDFGPVGIGQTKTEVVTVWNDGTVAIDIGRARTLGSAEVAVSSGRPLPVTLDPGSSLVLTVAYSPTAATEMLASLSIETSDEAVPEARVRLSGRGAGPLFEVTPEVIDFGVVRRTAPQRRSFVLLNAGSADVRVTGLSIGGHASFSLTGVPGLPARLGPGETLIPSVELVPTGTAGRFLGEVVVTTDDPAHAEVRIPVRAAFSETACQLDFQPARLNFGLVTPPYARRLEVQATNRGDRTCTLTGGQFVAPLDAAFTADPAAWPVALAPGQSVQLGFGYAPVDRRESKAVFSVTTDDASFPERQITLVGSSLAYEDLFVVPTMLDFGSIEPRCAVRGREVRVFNAGTVDASIESVTLRPQQSEATMSTPASFPTTLRAGLSEAFAFDYAPSGIGPDSGEIIIDVRGRPFPFVVPWIGQGVPQANVTERFEQGRARPVDVLFVVDNSCSMSEEQRSLVANFGDFIRTANVRSVDFRIAVTTTDVSGQNAGRLRGPVLSPSTANLIGEFERQANVGIRGSGFEQGLEAMDALFRRSPPDFLRPNVSLVVIIISDEDDGSPASVVTYFNSLRSVSPDAFVAVISGQARGCFDPSVGAAIPAPTYEAFVALTQGLSLSICAPWSNTLSNLGATVFGLQQAFALQSRPDPAIPIQVLVNGQPAPAGSWTFDTSTGRVVFDANQIPPEGATVEITYSPLC